MSNIPNRRERRASLKHAGILKQKRSLNFKDRCGVNTETQRRGKEIHQANMETFEKEKTEALEEKESQAIAFWKADGYDENEIKMLREAWAILAVKYKETWHTDKKTARKLMKEADALRNKRLFP